MFKQFRRLRLAFLFAAGLTTATAAANSYPRLEAAFNLAGIATDTYDYAVTDVQVQIKLPDSSSISLPAFFDGGTIWRVRHTPRTSGPYQITSIKLNGAAVAYTGLTATNWVITGPPTGAGYIRIDPTNPKRFATDDGRRYFPVGHNVSWNPTVSNDFPRIFQRMGAARENWTRIWMTHFYESLNLDWPKVDNTFGKLSLTVARRWDMIVDEAERAGIAMQVVFQHHGQYSTNVNPNWNENPYNTANGGFLSDATQFFTNATAKALTKRKLRYAIARWGYSPSIMAWEMFNEVEYTAARYAGQWTNIIAWHDEMAAFIRSQDPYAHLITTSSELSQGIWNSMDYYQSHNYASDMVGSSRNPNAPPAGSPAKPIFDGESGSTYNIPGLWLHALLWPSLMAGQGGASCPWWWDTIDPTNDYFLFKNVQDNLSLSGLPYQNNLVKTAPRVTGVGASSLGFAPGGYWGPVTEDVFLVEGGPPDGIISATRYLHGFWHQSNLGQTNGYTFIVDYPQAGTFSVQVAETSTSGNSNLRILLDGVLKTNVMFLSSSGGVTNITFSIPVPAGTHSIVLTNGATDWLVIGNLTLNPYISELGAYAVGNTNFQSAWVWHRTNLLVTSTTATLSGAVDVKNLQAGNYAASWTDGYTGAALSNFSLTIPANGATASVPTPAIRRSAVLTVGKSPQAALSGPVLTQTLASNSPTVFTALTLTNSGGLPLQYSLMLTGLNTTAYTALNSTQSDGPAYVWRDISAIGTNITSSFSALAPPKSAGDEGIAGPFNLGFEFPFFSGAQTPGVRTQVYVSPNGFITFNPFTGDRSANATLPNAAAPTNLVALFWDDLDASAAGKIWVASDPLAGEFTVQYDAVRIKSTAHTVTAQVVLRSTGEIICYYKSMGVTNSCTVGVQNAAASQGVRITHNSSAYLQSRMAVRINPAAWIQFARPAGFVPGGRGQSIDLAFRAGGLTAGVYTASLLVKTSDPLQPVFTQPVALTISSSLPAAPTSLTANAVSANQVVLNWTDNAVNETGFQVERRTGTNGAFAVVGSAAANAISFADFTIAPVTTYYYRVRATNAFGSSADSDLASAITPTAPIAINDATNTLEDTSVTIRVLANDYDPEGTPLSLVSASTTNGTAILNGTNVVFTPATNFYGTVVFSYLVSDGANQASATVTVTVIPVNDAPEAANDAFSLTQGGSLIGPAPGVLTNDTDVEGDALSAMLATPPLHGTLALSANGGFTYTPTNHYFGADSFAYRASDGSATSTVATVSLTIIALPPIQQWRLAYFGNTNAAGAFADDADWDGDGLKNIFEYAFNSNPTNGNASPLTFSVVSDHLRVVFPRTRPAPADITYLYEVATNLTSGVWNTGPAWATESVTDNLNGTETVTVTVTPSVSSNSAAFFRLRISQP